MLVYLNYQNKYWAFVNKIRQLKLFDRRKWIEIIIINVNVKNCTKFQKSGILGGLQFFSFATHINMNSLIYHYGYLRKRFPENCDKSVKFAGVFFTQF